MAKTKTTGVTVKTITPTVYLTGQYSASPEAKAKELTNLLKSLVAYGVWESALSAAEAGVPSGSFIVVDSKETMELDFSVEIVPAIFTKSIEDPKF